jgi:hypothetical protein
MFNGPKPDKRSDTHSASQAGPMKAKRASPGAAKISMDDKDGIAKLLSSLGRVTVKH